MLYVRGANAEGKRAEGAVGGGMGVAAHHCHARQGRTLLRPDDMHDPLALVMHAEFGDAEIDTVAVQGLDLQARYRITDARAAIGGGYIVVGHGEYRTGAPGLAAGHAQSLERLWRGDLVHQVAVDVDQRRAISILADAVCIPELVVECLAGHAFQSSSRWAAANSKLYSHPANDTIYCDASTTVSWMPR